MTTAKNTASNADRDQLMSDIEKTVENVISKMLPRTDQLRYNQLEKMTTDNAKMLTGNGDPERGLVYQVRDIKDDLEQIKAKVTNIERVGYALGITVILWVLNQWLGLIPLHP